MFELETKICFETRNENITDGDRESGIGK